MATLMTFAMVAATSLLLLYTVMLSTNAAVVTYYDVVSFGAKPDGKTDSSTAFATAWTRACASTNSATIHVPSGKFFVKTVTFDGPCKNTAITFKIRGTLVAASDYNVIGNTAAWILFRHVNGVNIYGGVLDGQGTDLWFCKNSGKSCPNGATSLKFTDSKNIFVSGLTSRNSQKFHIVFNSCQNVGVGAILGGIQGVQVSADGNSPNTDGIHVDKCFNVTIVNSEIRTGDDCISIGPGTSSLWIENVACGPGHGISIGSLGKYGQEAGVENVTVSTATFSGTDNGVRIKSWARPSTSFARDIIFQHVVMTNVKNPIIIDQHYCPDKKLGCPNQESGVKVGSVKYLDIHGSSATEVAVKFNCSSTNPCAGIILEDVKLTYRNQAAKASCTHASGTASGIVEPPSCLERERP